MSEPPRSRTHHARAADPLAQRLLFHATWRFAWRALERHRLADADRSDIAQEAVIAAWRGRACYRGDRGNPEQWLSRIVHNAAMDFLSGRSRDPLRVALDALPDPPGDGGSPEDRLTLGEVAALPEDERRAVVAIAIEGLTLREAAAEEGVSASTVHDRYARGLAALRAGRSRCPSLSHPSRAPHRDR